MNLSIIVLIRPSISEGWSPTGTFVMPGKSTKVMSRTFGEKIFKCIGLSEMPLFAPASLLVKALIQGEWVGERKVYVRTQNSED